MGSHDWGLERSFSPPAFGMDRKKFLCVSLRLGMVVVEDP